MKAMIFAAGMGSRLGELTQTTPKALVEVAGKPMLQHVIEKLKAQGVDGITINLYHLGDQIENFLRSKNNFGIEVNISKESDLLGTGGGLKKAQEYFKKEKNFIIYNSDIYCDLNLALPLAQHQTTNAIATLIVMKRESSRGLYFDDQGHLLSWSGEETQPNISSKGTQLAFSGMHIASPAIFQFMESESGNFSILKAYMNAVRAGQKVQAYIMQDTFWLDMGKPASLEELRRRLAR